jgi:selenocysteine lyase/cysteine desulfurase
MSGAGSDLSEMLDVAWVRSQFPSLEMQVNGRPAAFLDGPAGTQVPTQVLAAIQNYLVNSNANTHGAFLTSRRSDEMIATTREAIADFFTLRSVRGCVWSEHDLPHLRTVESNWTRAEARR